ncbi:hypothetical protein UFOVP1049_72 [uncultured Caudovirales phage]|uniref:Uncharacterized protein n=1 Tax=uncultured Caudovirales phage TaxID=2100421 RepID=A0A6J5Q980_9CAUD|nr:hypothetical protein UFOVP1049_72 [uncultured Caudovirales phage]
MRLFLVFVLLFSAASAGDKLILSTEPPPLPKKPPKQTGCAVQELYVIGLTMHDPLERHKAMLAWLDGTKCSGDDYVLIWNALPEWAGTSDSPLLRAKIMEKAR